MEDPIGQAASNAVAGGRGFWNNLTGLLSLNQQKSQQNREYELETKRLGLAEKKQALDAVTQGIQNQVAQQGLQTGEVGLHQAQKADFLQSHNPIDAAKQVYSQTAANKFLSGVKPLTDADVAESNASQLGADNAQRMIPNPKAAPGQVIFPMPSPEHRALFGIPDSVQQAKWTMPQDKFEAAKGAFQQAIDSHAGAELSKPFDQMAPEAQRAVIESYQKNAPPGVHVSDAEAVQAFRSQQLRTSPIPNPISDFGLIPTGGEFNPLDPSSLKLNLTAPIGGAGGAGALTPEQYKDFGEPLQKVISTNPELQLAQQKGVHTRDVVSYAEEKNPTVSSDKSLIMSYLKTIDPTVRVSEGTVTTVMDGMGLPDEVKNSVSRVMSGSLFTPEHRAWFKTAALQNLDNARQSATHSIESQLSIAQATGNPLASNVKLPPNVLPPSGESQKGPENARGDGNVPGSSSSGTRKFSSAQQAESANLPKGTTVEVFDAKSGRYRKAVVQ